MVDFQRREAVQGRNFVGSWQENLCNCADPNKESTNQPNLGTTAVNRMELGGGETICMTEDQFISRGSDLLGSTDPRFQWRKLKKLSEMQKIEFKWKW